MKKYLSILLVVSLILTGCSYWAADDVGVKSMSFLIYDNVPNEEGITSTVHLLVVPDYKNRTLNVTFEKLLATASEGEDSVFDKNEGIVGGSHFDSFVELSDLLAELGPMNEESVPFLSLEVLMKGEDTPLEYQLTSDYDDAEAPIYDFYSSLSPLFSQDVY